MENSLLYFPYINLPKSDWTIRTLLYYEKIGSIVPMEFFYKPEKNYDPFMLDLVKESLVIPINPVEQLDNPWQLNEPFLKFIQTEGYKIESKIEAFKDEKFLFENAVQSYVSQPAKVNSQKFDGELMYSLCQLGLAEKVKNNWFYVEQTTANYLMAYLASVLAGKLKLLPTTDKPFSVDYLRQFRTNADKLNNKRDKILQELIPMPMEINLKKMEQFKSKNIENLNRFRNVVEQIALNPIYNSDKLLNEKIKELKYEKDKLTAKMKESNFGSIFFGTACGIYGAFQGLAQAETTGAIIGGLPGFSSAIYAALKIEKAENIFDQTGMKYLSLSDKRLRFNP